MKMYFRTGHIIRCIFLSLLIAACSGKKETRTYLISDITIIDVENGSLHEHQYLSISGERIMKVSATPIPVTDSTLIVNGKGKFLIPGLWDMHEHYFWNQKNSTPLLIANGITGIREMFGDMEIIQQIRDSANRKLLIAPEIISSGAIIDGVPASWEGSDTLSIPSRAKTIVSKQLKEGVDFLKVYSNLNRECYTAIAKEANKNQIPFAGHVPTDVTIWEAIDFKQRSIEHLYGIMEACSNDQAKLHRFKRADEFTVEKMSFLMSTFNETTFDSLCGRLKNSETWVCPTLTVLRSLSYLNDPALKNDERLKYIPPYILDIWKSYPVASGNYYTCAQQLFKFQQQLVGKMQKAGVRILAGTDSPNPYCFPGFSLHDELFLMTEGGMSSHEALKAATLNPALFLHREKDYGAIAEHKIASLVLLDGNPLENIGNTKKIVAVFLKGTYFDKAALDKFTKVAELN